jgi:histidine phosphotransferase ChpT
LGQIGDEYGANRERLPAARRHFADRNTAVGFKMVATGQGARITPDVERALRGETGEEQTYDARAVQPFLTHKLAKKLNAGLTLTAREGQVELAAG